MAESQTLDAEADAILGSLGVPGAGGGDNKKKKKKKKGKAKAEVADESLNSGASEAVVEEPPEAPEDTSQSKEALDAGEPDAAAKILAELTVDSGEGKSAKDKKKKKRKGKGKKDEKPKSGLSAVGKLAAEHLAKKKEEEERLKREEAAEAARQAEELKRQEEEKRKEEERRERLREKRKLKREQARAEGRGLTKAQKAKAAKAAAFKEKVLAEGLVAGAQENRKKRVVYSKKKQQKTQQQTGKQGEGAEVEKSVQVEQESEKIKDNGVHAKESLEKAKPEVNPTEENIATVPVLESWDNEDAWEDVGSLVRVEGAFDDEQEEVVLDPVQTSNPCAKNTSSGKSSKKQSKAKQEGKPAKTAAERVRDQLEAREVEKERARLRREERRREALRNRSKDDLRSPICCVMGHVDTGKTKLLDKIRRTNVQDGEAGGITQQIGATYFPMESLRKKTDKLNQSLNLEYKVPGLLVIDTPGHESFTNLRKRGSSLCDIAILVIDIMHGLEQQTIESINLLRSRRTPFIVALNKIDRLYGWKAEPDAPFRETLAKQDDNVLREFESRTQQITAQLMEQSLNSCLYYENEDYRRVVSLVPTSAHTGEGVPDLLLLLVQLTQQMMIERLMFHEDVEATVIEVKKIEGIGTTIDIVLVNGVLKETDTIVVAGMNGAIATPIRALLTPQPLKEMRVKGEYVHHKELKAAMGVKIAANNLDEAIAGTQLLVLGPEDDEEELKEAVMADFEQVMGNVSTTGRGVCVQASTLGSLEALMEFLRVSNIPVASVNLGPIHKKDVMRASIMLEHQKEFATILAFDVKVTRDAAELAEELGVKLFTAEIIYHLFDQFTAYLDEVKERRREEVALEAVFPCILRIIPENVFNKKSPLVFGVDIIEGILKLGTPLVVPDKMVPDYENPGQEKMLELGRIVSIEKDHKEQNLVKRGNAVCIKVEGTAAQSYVQYGRHFDHENKLYSKLSRASIDALKANFKEDLEKQDWQTVIKLKKVFDIV